MKFTTEWLRDWMPVRVGPDELSATLTMAGLEVDDVAPVAPRQGALVALVETVDAHPDSDRLKVCRVSFGGSAEADVEKEQDVNIIDQVVEKFVSVLL